MCSYFVGFVQVCLLAALGCGTHPGIRSDGEGFNLMHCIAATCRLSFVFLPYTRSEAVCK